MRISDWSSDVCSADLTRKLGRRTAMAPKMGSEELAKIALGLMAERHFASVTIMDIASAAKVTGAMIYYHFKDKEHLFRSALANAIDRQQSVVQGKGGSVRLELGRSRIIKTKQN